MIHIVYNSVESHDRNVSLPVTFLTNPDVLNGGRSLMFDANQPSVVTALEMP